MSKRVGNTFFIKPEEESTCEYCGKVAELRPYGKNGERICFECGMKNIETTKEVFREQMAGVDMVILQ